MAVNPEEGRLDSVRMTWKIDFHHDDHTHPALRAIRGVASGKYAIPKVGETSPNVWYRIYLTAVDGQGLVQTTYRDYHPRLGKVTVATDPPGIPVMLDGNVARTPASFTAVAGTIRVIEATQVIRPEPGKMLIFEEWSDGDATPRRELNVPAATKTYLARYANAFLGNGDGLTGSYYTSLEAFQTNQPVLSQVDSVVDLDWKNSPPTPEIGDAFFYVRWEGFVQPYHTDDFTFAAVPPKGVSLWVNERQVIESRADSTAGGGSESIRLMAGKKYPLRLEYFAESRNEKVTLLWKSPLLPEEIIPRSQLSTLDFVTALAPASSRSTGSKIMPNPSRGSWQLVPGAHSGNTTLKMQDPQGRTMIERRVHLDGTGMAVQLQLPASAAPGIYFLHLQSRQTKEVLRVVKY
jgi:hypothetical protein